MLPATFMGGLCLGSLMLPRLVSARRNSLRVYALLELGIGILGILVLHWMPLAGGVYTAWTAYGLRGLLLRGAIAAARLLPPTFVMGATLPVLSRQIEARQVGTGHDVSWLGFFYGANIAGAVLGCLLSGFYLLRKYDVYAATYTAMAINLSMAGLALTLALLLPRKSDPDDRVIPAHAAGPGIGVATVYVAIALSGLCALAAEAIWTRMLGLLFGASVYALAIIVAVFLVGLGIGSGIGSLLCRILVSPRTALGCCQWLAAGAIAWTAYNLGAALPYWPINPSISANIWFNFELDLARAFWALLPPTLLWGASFPLALAAASSQGQDPAKLMSGIYAANTLGAIAGALGASLLLVSWIGSQHAEQLLIALSTAAALLLLLPGLPLRWAAGAVAVMLV